MSLRAKKDRTCKVKELEAVVFDSEKNVKENTVRVILNSGVVISPAKLATMKKKGYIISSYKGEDK
jgi:hypothetical protein